MCRIKCSRRRQDGAIGFCLSAFDSKTGGAVGVAGFNRAAGFTATALRVPQRIFNQTMRYHRRPEDEQQECNELVEAEHDDFYHDG